MRLAIDTNLLVLLIVGNVSRELIRQHKRLRSYTLQDFDQLLEVARLADAIVTTPNTLTEVSNLAGQGVSEPLLSEISALFAAFVGQVTELYQPSSKIVLRDEFERLGLADAAWLSLLDDETIFLTDDRRLCRAAVAQGHVAYDLEDLRN